MLVSCPLCGLAVTSGTKFCPNDATPIGVTEASRAVPNYQFIRLIGSGGMGDVYEAEHLVLKKRVAIKTLKSNLMETKAFMRFQTEAQAASRLQHPNIIGVYDCGMSLSGEPYMIMELVHGSTLAHNIKVHGCLSVEESIDIIIQVCKGVICAHEAGILHRDLKPSNILLAEQTGSKHYVARILDFGIAKILDSSESGGAQMTRTGELFGTPSYMSPEQCSGQKVDQRSDIYSMGCILYEMLTGDPPIAGKSAMETMLKHTTEKPLPLRQAAMKSFPQALENIVARALEKDPAKRYASVSEMLASIRNFQNGVAEIESTQKKIAPRKITAVDVAIVGLLAVAAAVCLLCMTLNNDTANKSAGLIEQNQHGTAETAVISNSQKESVKGKPTAENDNQLVRDENKSELLAQAIKEQVKVPADIAEGVTDRDLEPLRNAVTPVRVELRNCIRVTKNGIKIISTMPHVKFLDLADCTLSDDALPIIVKMPLVELNLARNHITNKGLTVFDEHCTIQNLYLKGTTRIGSAGLKPLSRLHNLRALVLDDCTLVNDASVHSLGTTTVDNLCLNRTSITDKCTATLVKIQTLRSLYLNETQISGRGLMELAKLKNLQELGVKLCARISPEDLNEFQRLRPDVKFSR